MNAISVSVIIPAYNASATIGRALEALSKQNCSQAFEVIVVDDGSSDDTGDIVQSFIRAGLEPARTTYVRQENAGPASARNHGARLAQGEYLAFTDSDCIPHEDWIAQLMAGIASGKDSGFRRNDSGMEVGVVAGSYGIANPQSLLARCIYKEILWRHERLMPDYPNSFGSYNFCVRKNVFDAVGGFDTGYRNASGEDNDLSYKIIGAGWRIYFQRQALVDHYHPTRVIKYLKEQYRHGFWRVKMYKDHPRMMQGDGYTYWKDIVEMPWVVLIVAGLLLTGTDQVLKRGQAIMTCPLLSTWSATWYILISFLIFEVLSALVITRCFFEGIFFGIVMSARAFARLFGFSTGILALLF